MALKNMSRRDMLKSTTGLFALGGILDQAISGERIEKKSIVFEEDDNIKVPDKPLTFIVIGAGNRGNVYASYALKYPKEMKIVGEAEPIPFRNERFAKKYDIEDKHRFDTWEDVFKVKKFADAVIITTPDHLHYGPAMEALDMGYDVILEKVVAQTWRECNDILKSTKKNDRIVAVCHVLRYTPYYRKMKEIVDSGTLGDLVSIFHLEPVGHAHYAHSFVRGNWRNTAESNPMILSKSCHDLDILRWLIGKPCKLISSFGSQTLCKAENAPEGSTYRCTDGCKIEPQCPYSAMKIYYRNHTYLSHFDLPEEGDRNPAILKAIKEGQYGRCVYHCDNDVVDHQVVSMEFEENITANFSMEALTHYGGRRTRIMFTMGDIVGDSEDLVVGNFKTDKVTKWNVKENAQIESGHGGGDFRLVRNFIQAVSQRDPGLLTSTIDASMESHLMGFMAEKSRHETKIMKVDMTM